MGDDFHLLMQSLAKSLLALAISIAVVQVIGRSCNVEPEFTVERGTQ